MGTTGREAASGVEEAMGVARLWVVYFVSLRLVLCFIRAKRVSIPPGLHRNIGLHPKKKYVRVFD